MPTYEPSLTKDDLRWLESLMQKIWSEHEVVDRFVFGGQQKRTELRIKRHLTPQEAEKFFTLVKDRKLVCSMCNSRYGFGIGMQVFEHISMPDETPEMVFHLSDEHLPGITNQHGHVDWDAAYHILSTFTHTEVNKRLLAYYGLPPAQDRSHYAY